MHIAEHKNKKSDLRFTLDRDEIHMSFGIPWQYLFMLKGEHMSVVEKTEDTLTTEVGYWNSPCEINIQKTISIRSTCGLYKKYNEYDFGVVKLTKGSARFLFGDVISLSVDGVDYELKRMGDRSTEF